MKFPPPLIEERFDKGALIETIKATFEKSGRGEEGRALAAS
jgi:hypothetical protein